MAIKQWVVDRNWCWGENGKVIPGPDFGFPDFRKGMKLFHQQKKMLLSYTTSTLIKTINVSAPNLVPKFQANSGRSTVATLCLMLKNQEGVFFMRETTLEAALGWVQGSRMKATYTARNMGFMPSSMAHTIQTIRNTEAHADLDERFRNHWNRNFFSTYL